MATQHAGFFAPPTFNDAEKNRTAASLNVILLTLIALSIPAIAVTLTQGNPVNTLSVGGTTAIFVGLYLLTKRGELTLPSIIVPAFFLILITFLAARGQGVKDVTVYGYTVAIALAALLLGKRAPIPMTGVVIMALVGMYIGQQQGLIDARDPAGVDDVVVIAIFLSISAVLLRVLMTNLTDTLAEVRTLNDELEARVARRTKALQEAKLQAEQALKRAEEADRVKSQFLASMSHELRTPLNAIINFTEIVMTGVLGPVNDRQKDVLAQALDSGKHLLSLINDVLDITKIQAGMMKLFVEENINLRLELKPVLATAHTLVEDKPVTIIDEISEDLPEISADRRRVRQIMLNLVSNAAKFTEEGTIRLSVVPKGETILFAVADTGPGIPQDMQTLIFEPFQQTETGIKHAGGTGLGLPICKRLAEAHGGRLWVESTMGKGSTFYVELPVIAEANDEPI